MYINFYNNKYINVYNNNKYINFNNSTKYINFNNEFINFNKTY